MAEVEVLGCDMADGRVRSLKVRFKGTTPRQIDRDTALQWVAAGHALVPTADHHGHGHAASGGSLVRVEVDGVAYLRGDTQAEAADQVVIPGGHH